MQRLSLLLLVLLSLPTQASTYFLRDPAEILQFAQSVEFETLILSEDSQASAEINMGSIKNSKTNQTIRILCTAGTREACTQISFYYEAGVRDPQPFQQATLASINKTPKFKPSKMRFWLTNAWIAYNDDNSAFWVLPPIGPILTIVDTLLYPIRLVSHLGQNSIKKGQHERARGQLYRALTSGATLEVSSASYQRIENLIRSIPKTASTP